MNRLPSYTPFVAALVFAVVVLSLRGFPWAEQLLLRLLPAALVASVALFIAVELYPIQKKEDRQLEIAAEKRSAVSKLVSELEALVVKVNTCHSVGVKIVPYFANDFASLEAAIGVAKVHNLDVVAQSAVDCRKTIQLWRQAIVRSKRKRKLERGKRVPEYVAEMDRVDEAFSEVVRARKVFYEKAGEALRGQGLEPPPIDPIDDET